MVLDFYYYVGLQPKMSAGIINEHKCMFKSYAAIIVQKLFWKARQHISQSTNCELQTENLGFFFKTKLQISEWWQVAGTNVKFVNENQTLQLCSNSQFVDLVDVLLHTKQFLFRFCSVESQFYREF